MATFTTFSDDALSRYLIMFGIGDLISTTPITDGIENSNYFIKVSKHGEETEFVLTIIEGYSFDDIPFFNKVTSHLFNYGLPVPAPRQTLDGMTMTIFCGKPTLLFPKLEGSHSSAVNSEQCHAIGKVLADIHKTMASQSIDRANPFDSDWMFQTLDSRRNDLSDADHSLLLTLCQEYEMLSELSLPGGVIHGDLFKDNALFHQGELSGVIDFYHACNDFLVQDIAISLNDWCRSNNGDPDMALATSLLAGYESVRPLEPEEKEFLPHFRRTSCARFALTRLLSGDGEKPLKDPLEFISLARQL